MYDVSQVYSYNPYRPEPVAQQLTFFSYMYFPGRYKLLLASSQALRACGDDFFLAKIKNLYFYFENLIYKCFFFEK